MVIAFMFVYEEVRPLLNALKIYYVTKKMKILLIPFLKISLDDQADNWCHVR